MSTLFGLIGKSLGHSFSQKYFTKKFETLELKEHAYQNFELDSIDDLEPMLKFNKNLKGFNVTNPFKSAILPFLTAKDEVVRSIGACNTVKLEQGLLIGFNTDVYGFERSLSNFMKANAVDKINHALVLGTGGASKAIRYVLEQMGAQCTLVSRTASKGHCTYGDLHENFPQTVDLIVNTTPLGTYPNTEEFPDLPYEQIEQILCFDLVYNPGKTVFLNRVSEKACPTQNGLEMLEYQAERAWMLWNTSGIF